VRHSPSAPEARVDVETMRRDQERLWPESQRSSANSPAATVDLAKELAEEIAKLRGCARAAASPAKPGDLAKELAAELAKLGPSSPTADEECEDPATTIAVDEFEASSELAEVERVRRAVWERETKELEEREEDAERMKRARWAAASRARGELADDEREDSGPAVKSAAARSSEGRGIVVLEAAA